MTCPHCGAAAREQERFCPSCSRLIDSPLLKMRRELDAARAAMLRDRPAPLAKSLATPAPPATPPSLPVARPATPEPPRGKNEKRKAEIRARLAAKGTAVPPPPPTQREAHSPDKHASVRDDTLQEALKSQTAAAAATLQRARDQAAPPPPPRRKGKGRQAEPAQQGPPPAEAQAAPSWRRRTSAVVVLLLLNLATLATLYAWVTALDGMPEGSLGRNAAEGARVAAYVIGGVLALATLGLWTVQPFGRALQRLASVLWLPVFPFGTLYAFVALLYLGSRGVRLLFSGRSGFSAQESVLLDRSRKYAPVMAILLFVLGGLAWGSLLGTGAAIEPALRAPGTVTDAVGRVFGTTPSAPADPREAMLTDLEALAASQSAYRQANRGFYDRVECLVTHSCLPGGAALGPGLDARFLEPVRHGYEFRLRLGPPPDPRPEGISATSATGFTYVALPTGESPDTWGYCVERHLTVCRFAPAALAGTPPGECPAGCEFVR